MVLLRDWCASVKLIADRDASGLSNVDTLRICVLVLLQPVKVQMLSCLAKLPAVRAFMLWQGFEGLDLSPRRVRKRLVGQYPFLHDILEEFFAKCQMRDCF